MTTLTSKETWEKLKAAGELRKHPVVLARIKPDSEIPEIVYHRTCYQRFTLKRDLDKLRAQRKSVEEQLLASISNEDCDQGLISDEDSSRPKRKKKASILLPKECLFCKDDKTKKRTREKLRQCIDERAERSIKSAAQKHDKNQIMSIPDLIAAEAHYHKSCYDKFTRVNRGEEHKESNDPNYANAYQEVLKVCLELEFQPDIIPYMQLVNMMKAKLKEKGLTLPPSTEKNLYRNILRDAKAIKIVNVNGLRYLYPKNISTEELATKCINLKNELNQANATIESRCSEERNLVNCIKMVRQEIRKLDDTIPWPPQPIDLLPDKLKIPNLLNLMLTTLLEGENQQLKEKPERLRISLAQDIIYAVTKGKLTLHSILVG